MSLPINFLWIGDHLNLMCQLSLKSFLDLDHGVILWTYNKDIKNVPSGVLIKNANEILEEKKIFSYKGFGDCRDGSYGGFSDIFRYYLLYKVGGWYCDMDVTCLDNFSKIENSEYIIRPHNSCGTVANIIKTPKKCSFIKKCIEDTEKKVTVENDDWVLPLKILNDNVKKFDIEKFKVSKDYFGNDDIKDLCEFLKFPFIKDKCVLPKYAIHWCNEAVSSGRWMREIKRSWEKPLPTTLYYKLLKKHELI
jgi:hypothetical protein